MKAVTYRTTGPARDVLKIEDIDCPAPGPGEVRVEIAYSGVNPSDVKARAGSRPMGFPVVIPHSDGSGTIVGLGDGVPAERLGETVWIWNGQWRRAFGTAASQMVLPAEQAVPLPDGVDLQTGAVMGIPGLTAAFSVFSRGPVAGQTILVQGGAGTVGYLAVQLAKWGGARVIATARGVGIDRVRQAGADHVLDYAQPALSQVILDANQGQPVDRIIEVEFGRNVETDTAVIAENGHICAYGSAADMTPRLPFYPLMFKAVTLEMALIYILTPLQRAHMVSRVNEALGARAISVPIARIHDLEAAATAHEEVEAGGRSGAILLRS